MPARNNRIDGGSAELNLLPVMNLMAVLIPFLLMAAQFVSLSVIDTALPSIKPGTPDPSAPKLNLWVAIRADGYVVSGTDPMLHRDGRDDLAVPCLTDTCGSPDAYDVGELGKVLGWLKDEWPEEQTAVVAATPEVPFEVIVRTMDAVRGTRKDGPGRPLFPDVVIASAPGAAAPAAGGG